MDGVALKQAVDAWVSAPASEQSTFFAVVQGIRVVEWGIRSYVDFTSGLTLILLALVIASTRRIPRPVGYIMGLSGLAYIVQGYGYGTRYTSISDYNIFILASVSYQLLIFVWAIWLLIVAWRIRSQTRLLPDKPSGLELVTINEERSYPLEGAPRSCE